MAKTVAPVIVQTEAGPTRSMAPQPEETKKRLPLPEVETSWLDFYRNLNAVVEGREELIVKPEQARRVLRVIETVSYTHLDVYKRQVLGGLGIWGHLLQPHGKRRPRRCLCRYPRGLWHGRLPGYHDLCGPGAGSLPLPG